MKEQTGKWDRFWRSFNPPLPDVMQAEMLKGIGSNRTSLHNFVRRSVKNWTRMAEANAGYEAMFEQIMRRT